MGLRNMTKSNLRVFINRRNNNTLWKSSQQHRAKKELVGHDFLLLFNMVGEYSKEGVNILLKHD